MNEEQISDEQTCMLVQHACVNKIAQQDMPEIVPVGEGINSVYVVSLAGLKGLTTNKVLAELADEAVARKLNDV